MPTVVSVAYPFARVDADPVGGAEQVLSHLDRGLVSRGWRSVILAQAGSTPAGELVALPRRDGPIDDRARADVRAAVAEALARTIAEVRPDLLHFHGVDFADHLPPEGPPALATLHLPLDWYPPDALAPTRPRTWLLPVSADQASRAPPGARLLAPIENGVELDGYPTDLRPRTFALTLGRVCPEKGLHLALDAAFLAGAPLLAAGEVFPYPDHQRYFAEEVRPRLDARRRWLGPVQGAAKRRLLAAARCVLVPSLAPETSSLVAREALAAGTPVVAFLGAGALGEVIEPGRTGILVSSVAEMAEAIETCGALDREACRAAARARFDARVMIEHYLALYARLIAGGP